MEEFDAACCRLATRRHTAAITRNQIEEIGQKIKSAFPEAKLYGGVFSSESDDLWVLSGGSDVEYSSIEQWMVDQAWSELQEACVPSDPRFTLRPAKWNVHEMTVVAASGILAGEVIGKYQGYYMKSAELSNERFNASVGGTGGDVTVDPCYGEDAPLLEWKNSVTHYINEPPPGCMQNCAWRIIKGSSPEIVASKDITAGEELFLFYGEGHSPLRDYAVAHGLDWQETDDSYQSD
jgi:hypothetical protein